MSRINFSLYANDPVLGGIADLSTARILQQLGTHLDHSWLDVPFETYVINNVRYAPRQKLVLGLTAPGSCRPIAMRIYPPGNLTRRVAAARAQGSDQVFAIPSINAIVWVFPSEKKLDLQFLQDHGRLALLLEDQRQLQLTAWQLVRYVPEHGYTFIVHGKAAAGELQQGVSESTVLQSG